LRINRKYLVAVALLAVLAVVFGVVGTIAPSLPESATPEQWSSSSSSDSIAHFQSPPTYYSGWVDITDKCGQFFNITHDLNTTEALVDVMGREDLTSGNHKLFFGATEGYTEWNRTYGGAYDDNAFSLVQTNDGGYAIAGWTESYGASVGYYPDSWLVKTDANGNAMWNKTYGGTSYEWATSVVQSSDGGYVIACKAEEFDLIKTDAAGNMLWNKTYTGYLESLVQTNDGGYAMAGSFPVNNGDAWLVKTNSTGDMQWNKTYGGTGHDFAVSLVQTYEGGYALVGYTDSFGAGSNDVFLIRTDASGNARWNRTYGGTGNDAGRFIIRTLDGGYAIAGQIDLGGNIDSWLIKTDLFGNMQWGGTYGGTSGDYAYSLVQNADGSYVLASETNSFGAGASDICLIGTDASGNMLYSKMYGGASGDNVRCIIHTRDGGYAVAGWTQSYGAGGRDFWLVKAHRELGSPIGLSIVEFTNSTITFYRGSADPYWNYVCVRIWTIKEPTWQFGDINQDGVVDAKDLYIVSRNYGKTFSALSLTGIIAIAGVHTYKKRERPK